MITLLDDNEKPEWVIFPVSYLKLVQEGKDEFLPWYLIDKNHLLVRLKGLKSRYPTRNLFLLLVMIIAMILLVGKKKNLEKS